MKAELITIGDEILIGQIVNTNSVFLAKELNKIGIEIDRIFARVKGYDEHGILIYQPQFNIPKINSTKKYCKLILLLQFLHLPFKIINDKKGILSYHLI